jgi:hypothetical protein
MMMMGTAHRSVPVRFIRSDVPMGLGLAVPAGIWHFKYIPLPCCISWCIGLRTFIELFLFLLLVCFSGFDVVR